MVRMRAEMSHAHNANCSELHRKDDIVVGITKIPFGSRIPKP